jgi:hypothetical protein
LLIGIAVPVRVAGNGGSPAAQLKREGVIVHAPEYIGTAAADRHTRHHRAGAALPQPATFGVRRPVVLLPDALAGAPASLRRAVVTHELFHVRRRDWLSMLAEEAVRTALWFHPAILWMTSQIQLAREEIVDELTVSSHRRSPDVRGGAAGVCRHARAQPGARVRPAATAVSSNPERVEGESYVQAAPRVVCRRPARHRRRRELVCEYVVPDRQGGEGRRGIVGHR